MNIVQQLAVNTISQVLAGRNLNQVLEATLGQEKSLTPQERGALQDLSFGTLRFYGQLSSILKLLLNKPLSDHQIEVLLLVSLYQLQYSKAAKHAIVDHAVSAAKKMNVATAGLVNAVLRNFLRKESQLILAAERTEEGRYSYPQWWIDEIKSSYKDKANEVLRAGNQHPPMMLRVNQKAGTIEEYSALLRGAEIEFEIVGPDAIKLAQPLAVEKIPEFFNGRASVQDAGAQQAAHLLDVRIGMRVLDACAAPGGKTAHLLEMADIEMVAVDKDERRLSRVGENLTRLNLKASLLCGDASNPEAWWDKKPFQRILADVPCSASGVIRRHPDIKWLRRPSDIEQFALQQEEILSALWPLLAKGGKLLYATCSIFERENRVVINRFLLKHIDARQLPVSLDDGEAGQLLPNDRHDGFFYALLQKNE